MLKELVKCVRFPAKYAKVVVKYAKVRVYYIHGFGNMSKGFGILKCSRILAVKFK